VARALERLEREGARAVGGPHEPPGAHQCERALGRHELRAVDQRQPFLRAQPDWLEPRPRQRLRTRDPLAVEPRLALADEWKREVRERRKVAGGADGAA